MLRNFGTTAAHDVRLTIDPAPRQAVFEGGPLWLPRSIPVLAPGQEWRTLWDSGVRSESDLPDRHEASVEYKDSDGRDLPPLRSILDFTAHKQGNVRVYGIHDAAKSLHEIEKQLKKWHRPGHSGLAVTAWNGDAADERDLVDVTTRVTVASRCPSRKATSSTLSPASRARDATV